MKIKFIQFELWKDCNCKHDFCFNLNCIKQNKYISLDFVLQKIQDHDYISKYNQIGLIGGELFDDQQSDIEINQKFLKIVDIICTNINKNIFNKFYLTSSLIFKDLKSLEQTLNLIKKHNCLSKTLLCTSYDTKYRFNTEEEKTLWQFNMKYLHEKYPELNLHTEIIITGDFIDCVMSNKFDILKFKKDYSTAIDYLEPFTGLGSKYRDKYDMEEHLPGFFPKRRQFLDFLKKIVLEKNLIDKDTLFSKNLRCDTLYMYIDGKLRCIDNRKTHDNRHGFKTNLYQPQWGYLDYDHDMVDDLKMLD